MDDELKELRNLLGLTLCAAELGNAEARFALLMVKKTARGEELRRYKEGFKRCKEEHADAEAEYKSKLAYYEKFIKQKRAEVEKYAALIKELKGGGSGED